MTLGDKENMSKKDTPKDKDERLDDYLKSSIFNVNYWKVIF